MNESIAPVTPPPTLAETPPATVPLTISGSRVCGFPLRLSMRFSLRDDAAMLHALKKARSANRGLSVAKLIKKYLTKGLAEFAVRRGVSPVPAATVASVPTDWPENESENETEEAA